MARMRRREFVKAMVAAPITAKAALSGEPSAAQQTPNGEDHPKTPPPAGTGPAQTTGKHFDYRTQQLAVNVPDAVAAPEGHFLSAEQMATLRKLAEIFMPAANGYPGAAQADAPEFLDFLLRESPVERRQMYQSGLMRLNAEARKAFGVSFVEVNSAQADKLLRPWLRTFMTDHPPTEPYTRFINLVHHELRQATQNSRAWSIAATASGERAPGIGDYWAPVDPFIEKYV